jgi:hypothetical protein
MSRPPHRPTPETRQQATQLSGQGVPQPDIAKLLKITLPTLHKHYRNELDLGMARANAVVAGRLFRLTETNVAAAIFWMKARAGWREKHEVEVTGKAGGPVQHSVDAVGAVGALMEQLAATKAGSEG